MHMAPKLPGGPIGRRKRELCYCFIRQYGSKDSACFPVYVGFNGYCYTVSGPLTVFVVLMGGDWPMHSCCNGWAIRLPACLPDPAAEMVIIRVTDCFWIWGLL